jgi:hypothetical protein
LRWSETRAALVSVKTLALAEPFDAGLRGARYVSISQHRDDEILLGTGLVRGEMQRATGFFTSVKKPKA